MLDYEQRHANRVPVVQLISEFAASDAAKVPFATTGTGRGDEER